MGKKMKIIPSYKKGWPISQWYNEKYQFSSTITKPDTLYQCVSFRDTFGSNKEKQEKYDYLDWEAVFTIFLLYAVHPAQY